MADGSNDIANAFNELSKFNKEFSTSGSIPVSKQDIVATKSEEKKASLSDTTYIKQVNLAPERMLSGNPNFNPDVGRMIAAKAINSPSHATSMLAEYGAMQTLDFKKKYNLSFDQLSEFSRAVREGYGERFATEMIERSNSEIAGDAVKDFGAGAANIVGSVSAIAGIAMDQAGQAGLPLSPYFFDMITEGATDAAKAVQETKSDKSKEQSEQYQLDKEIRVSDIDSKYEGEEGFLSSLAQIGEKALATGQTLLENPEQIASMAVEAAPSLLVSAGAGKVASAGVAVAEKAAIKTVTDKATKAALQSKIRKDTLKASMAAQPAINAILEGGSAAVGVKEEISGMTDSYLMENSPRFAELSKEVGAKEARNRITRDASAMAAVIQGASGALTARINARFEAAPLTVSKKGLGGLAETAGDVAKESLEEGIQGLTGSLAENITVKTQADKTRDLSEGIGEDIVEGAAAGGALTSGVRSGAITRDAAITSVLPFKVVGSATGSAIKSFAAKRNANIDSEIASRSPDNPEARKELEAAHEEALSVLVPEKNNEKPLMASDESSEVVSEEVEVEENPASNAIRDAFFHSEEEFENMPDHVRSAISDEEGTPNTRRYGSIIALAEAYKSGEESQKEDYLVELYNQAMKVFNLNTPEIAEYLTGLDEESGDKQAAEVLNSSVMAVMSFPEVQEAFMALHEMRQTTPVEITEDNVDTEEVQQEIKKAETIARVNPLNTNSDVVDTILDLSRKRKITLTEEQANALTTASEIQKLVKIYTNEDSEASLETILSEEGKKTSAQVRQSLISAGHYAKDGYKESLVDHLNLINEFANRSDTESLINQMKRLTSFVQGQLNKLDAMDRSSKGGKGEKFKVQIAAEGGKMVESSGEYYFIPGNKRSENNYYDIFEDTTLAAAIQNLMAKRFPEAGFEPIELPKLSLSISRRVKREARRADFMNRVMEAGGLVPYEGAKNPNYEAPKKNDEPLISGSNEEVLSASKERELTKASGGNRPLSDYIKSRFKGINPRGHIGKELRARGVTSKTHVGLFSNNGAKDLDNIPASEEQYLSQMLGEDNGYINYNALIDALSSELVDGIPQRVSQEQQDAFDELEARREELDRLAQEEASETAAEFVEDVTEDTVVVESEEEAEAQVSLKEEFPELNKMDSEVDPRYPDISFTSAFQRSNKPNKLNGVSDPIGQVEETISSNTNPDIKSKYGWLVNYAKKISEKAQNNLLRVVKEKHKGKTLKDSPQIMGYYTMKPLMITEGDFDTGIKYNQQLLDKASLATADWFASLFVKNPIKPDRLAQSLGITESMLPSEAYEMLNNGNIPLFDAAEGLAKNIMDFWGVKPDNDTELTYSKGLAGAIALEMIDVLIKEGLLNKSDQVQITKEDGTINYLSGIYLNKDNKTVYDNMKNFFSKSPDEIKKSIFEDYEATHHIGKPPANKSKGATYLRSDQELGNEEINAINAIQNIGHYLNKPFIGLIEALGIDNYKKLLGYRDIEGKEELYNAKDLQSIKGKNQSLDTNVESMFQLRDLVVESTENSDLSDEQIPVFFAVEMSKVARLQYQNNGNPQSNKTSRESLVSTWSTLDLNNPDDHLSFWLTVGQMSDTMKVEKQVHNQDLIPKIEETVRNKYQPSIEVMGEYLFTGEISEEGARILNQNILGNGAGVDDFIIHAIMAVAQYDKAKASKDPSEFSNFRHGLALEADGVTNGPANAYVKMTTGDFDENQVSNLERFGLLFGNEQRVFSDKTPTNDFYEVSSEYAVQYRDLHQQALDAGVSDNTVYDDKASRRTKNKNDRSLFKAGRRARYTPKDVSDAVTRMFQHFAPYGVTVDAEGNWSLNRNAAKNPLTKSTYGAGAMGTARGITSDILADMFAKASQSLQEGFEDVNDFSMYPSFNEDMNILLNTRISINKDGSIKSHNLGSARNGHFRGTNLKEFTLTADQFEALAANINSVYVTPLMQGINRAMGTAFTNMQSIIKATQFQAEAAAILYNQLYQPTDQRRLYSPKKEKELKAMLSGILPTIYTQYQTFAIGGFESTQVYDEKGRIIRPSTSLDDSLSYGATIDQPASPGVSAGANLNIGTGDGLMMTLANAIMQNPPPGMDRILSVFDGQNLPADAIKELSQHMNKSVHAVWGQNTVRDVLNSFDNFLRLQDILPEGALADIAKEMRIDHNTIREDLSNIADNIDIRQEVMNSFNHSVDQMAGGANSYHHIVDGGEIGNDIPSITKALNERFTEISNRKVKEPSIDSAVKRAGTPTTTKGVVQFGVSNLIQLTKGMNKDQRRVFGQIIYNNVDSDYRIFAGNLEAINEHRAKNDLDPITVEGQIDLENKTIYLINPSAESLIHELIHAVIGNKINQYYTDIDSMPEASRLAVENLNTLMNNFLNLSGATDAEESSLISLAQALDTTGTNAGRLNEFVAWVLANPALSQIAQSQRVWTPVLNALKASYKAIKKLLGIRVNNDNYYGHILTNAKVLAQDSEVSVNSNNNNVETILNMARTPRTTPRAVEVLEDFKLLVEDHIDSANVDNYLEKQGRAIDINRSEIAALDPLNSLKVAGFKLDEVESRAFVKLQTVFFSGIDLGGPAMVKAQEVYENVLENIDYTSFMRNPKGNDPKDTNQALDKYNALFGKRSNRRHGRTRNDAFSNFMAMSQVNGELRSILEGIKLPEKKGIDKTNIDTLLTSATVNAINAYNNVIVGGPKDKDGATSKEVLDHVMDEFSKISVDQKTAIENIVTNTADTVDSKIADVLQNASGKAGEWIRDRQEAIKNNQETTNKIKNALISTASGITALINKEHGKIVGTKLTNKLNTVDGLHPIKELFRDIMGRTDINKGVFDFINKVKAFVSAVREEYREQVPKIIASKFSRELTSQEWSDLHTGIGKTGLSVLMDSMSLDSIAEVLTDNKKLTKEINTLSSQFSGIVNQKAKELAHYMMTGNAVDMLAVNAHVIGNVYGNAGDVADIDKLVTLLAIQEMDAPTGDSLSNLVQTEKDGVFFSIAYARDKWQREKDKTNGNTVVLANEIKGYIPSEDAPGASIVVGGPKDHVKLENTGYTKIDDFGVSRSEKGGFGLGIYHSVTSGKSTYTQGAMQTSQLSQNGIDIRTGRRINGNFSSDIVKLGDVDSSIGKAKAHKNQKSFLVPIYDASYQVVAYQRTIPTEYLNLLQRNTHFGEMIGAWAGRQIEEKSGRVYNETLVDLSHEVYQKDYALDPTQYINLADPEIDAVYADSWSIIPREMKQYIETVYGKKNFFPVRKDMVDLTVGHRNASVSDLWTGTTRIKPEVADAIKQSVRTVFGKKSYEYLVRAEKGIQSVVSDAKTLIVVKSVIVPAANMVSNFYQLMQRGIPARSIVSGTSKYLIEINKYLDNYSRAVSIMADIDVETDDFKKRKLQAKLAALKDVNRRLSIWPLIEAGEFSTISEGLTEADVALRNGKFSEWVEAKAEKLPSGVRDLGRYGLISQTTALYKGLNRAVQYGDFIAKAILYEDLTKRQKKTHAEALGDTTEEFVNYNIPAGRTRTYLESIGVLWFWNFKVRSIKVALRTMRDNPARAFLGTMLMPSWGPLNVGTAVSDNLIAVGMEGKLGYSVGWGMGIRSPSLNPWFQLFG